MVIYYLMYRSLQTVHCITFYGQPLFQIVLNELINQDPLIYYTLDCSFNHRCGVCCDPWGYPLRLDKSFRDVTQPLLIINTDKFQFRENLRPILILTPEPKATSGPRQNAYNSVTKFYFS